MATKKRKYLANASVASDRNSWDARAEHDEYRIRSTWRVVDARPEPVCVCIERVDGRGVASHRIRELPIGSMLAECRQQISWTATVLAAAQEQLQGRPRLAKRTRRDWASTGPQRGQRTSVDTLQEVADVYRSAWGDGLPVNEAVRERFHLSQSGAAKRIMAARAAGLLEGVGRTS